MWQTGDLIEYRPKKLVTVKKDKLHPNDKRLIEQYNSPCMVYITMGYWMYLYRLLDGCYHVATNTTDWIECDVDLEAYPNSVEVMTRLLG